MLLHIECSRALLVRKLVFGPSASEAVQPAARFVAFCRERSSMGQNIPVRCNLSMRVRVSRHGSPDRDPCRSSP
jgi:hypothetical protein